MNIVESQSTQSFYIAKFNLLNNGLNFGIPDSQKFLEEVIAQKESAIQYMKESFLKGSYWKND